jgi:hypothetical protein
VSSNYFGLILNPTNDQQKVNRLAKKLRPSFLDEQKKLVLRKRKQNMHSTTT